MAKMTCLCKNDYALLHCWLHLDYRDEDRWRCSINILLMEVVGWSWTRQKQLSTGCSSQLIFPLMMERNFVTGFGNHQIKRIWEKQMLKGSVNNCNSKSRPGATDRQNKQIGDATVSLVLSHRQKCLLLTGGLPLQLFFVSLDAPHTREPDPTLLALELLAGGLSLLLVTGDLCLPLCCLSHQVHVVLLHHSLQMGREIFWHADLLLFLL